MSTRNYEEWVKFHQENPKVYELFDMFTRMVIAKGFKHYGARDVIHRIRWETDVVTTDPNFKMNNNHSPYYAREWMKRNPEHGSFFYLRKV